MSDHLDDDLDHVGVAERLGGSRVDVLGVGGEDGARELAHLLTADEVRGGRREDAADELGVHGHPIILPRGPGRAREDAGGAHRADVGARRGCASGVSVPGAP